MDKLYGTYRSNIIHFPNLLKPLSENLGVSIMSLYNLGAGLNVHQQSWVFPERDSAGKVIGLGQRALNGSKFMVTGSKRGLIYALNPHPSGEKYVSGKDNWIRVSKELPCPLCGKSDGCLLPSRNPTDPPAIVCVHIPEGAYKSLELGYLHILKPEKNIIYGKDNVLFRQNNPIFIVEGASDVAAGMDLGFTTIGRPSAEGGNELLKEMLSGQEVVVLGERDSGAGIKGMEKTFRALKPICKSVIKLLPPGNIKDLRQWKNLTKISYDLMLEYIDKFGDSSLDPDIFENDIAAHIAKVWLRQEKTKGEHLILRIYNDDYVEYKKSHYQIVDKRSIKSQIYNFLDGKRFCKTNTQGDTIIAPYKPTRAKVTDIEDALNAQCLTTGTAPCWLNEMPVDPSKLLVFQNGILDVEKYIRGEICLYNPTPDFFTFNAFPYDFNESLESELWMEFLNDIYNKDTMKILLLSQWFGYNCVPDMSYEKLMLFTGRPRSGKSTVVDTLHSTLGDRLCASTSFQGLTGTFGYQPLVNKYAALIGDAKSPRAGDVDAVLEKLLSITGGDTVSVNRKYKTELPSTSLKCRFTITMNDLPVFSDHARALEPRLNIILFPNSYEGREDRTLKQRLKTEAKEGRLINFALRGLRDLYTRKNFIVPKDSIAALQQFRELSAPVTAFVNECCHTQPPQRKSQLKEEYYVLKNELYDIWCNWCRYQGRKPGYKPIFSQHLLSASPNVETVRRRVNGVLRYMYKGIRLKESAVQDYS